MFGVHVQECFGEEDGTAKVDVEDFFYCFVGGVQEGFVLRHGGAIDEGVAGSERVEGSEHLTLGVEVFEVGGE